MRKTIACPKNEKIWCSYYDISGNLRFIITSKVAIRDFYFLYEIFDKTLKKLGKSRSPTELEEKYGINKSLLGS